MPEKEIEILRMCSTPRRNKWLNQNVVRGATLLSDYLKDLQLRGYLSRNVQTREYETTQEGLNFLMEHGIIEEAANSKLRMPIRIESRNQKPESNYQAAVDFGPIPFNPKTENVTINGFLYLDEGHERNFKKIAEELNRKQGFEPIASFFRNLSAAICRAYGYNGWAGSIFDSLQIKDLITKQKVGLDFTAGISFQFDGRSLVGKIKWKELIKSALDQEKKVERIWKRRKTAIMKNKNYREAWLEYLLAMDLLDDSLFQLCSAKGIIANEREIIEKNIGQKIRKQRKSFPRLGKVKFQVPSNNEVQNVMKNMEEEGAIRIVKKYVLEVDQSKLKSRAERIVNLFNKLEERIG